MARLTELPLSYRLFLRGYPWRRIDPVPWAPLAKPIVACRVALVSSAGLSLPGQQPFDESVKGGDPSFRVLPADTEVSTLVEHHRSQVFDHAGIDADRNLAFPLDRLREMAEEGRVGEVAPRHLTMMGSLTAPGRMVKTTAPAAAAILVEDQVDLALLVPV